MLKKRTCKENLQSLLNMWKIILLLETCLDKEELNRKISDTINQFVYPNRKGPFRANGTQEPSRGYSADTSYSSQHSSHNNTAQQTGPHHYSYGPGGTMPGKSANPVPKPSPYLADPPEYGMEQPHTRTPCTARALYAIHRSCTCRRISDGRRLGVSPDCSAAAQRLVSIPYLQVQQQRADSFSYFCRIYHRRRHSSRKGK